MSACHDCSEKSRSSEAPEVSGAARFIDKHRLVQKVATCSVHVFILQQNSCFPFCYHICSLLVLFLPSACPSAFRYTTPSQPKLPLPTISSMFASLKSVVALGALAVSSLAVPVLEKKAPLVVWNPEIYQPTADTVWR